MPLKIFANTYYEFFNNIFPGVGALSSFGLLDHSPYHGVFVGFRLMFDTNPPGSPGVGPKGKPMTDAKGYIKQTYSLVSKSHTKNPNTNTCK